MRRQVSGAAALFLFLALPAIAQADQGADSVTASVPARKPVHHLNPSIRIGARVQGTLISGPTLQGTVLAPFTMDSQRIALCLEPGQGCSGASDLGAATIEVADLTSLRVRGSSRNAGGYLGFLVGALIGTVATGSSSDDAQPAAIVGGAFGGLALGAFIGSRIHGWQPVFPCDHGCAAGEYP
jgi:hypothetical protein